MTYNTYLDPSSFPAACSLEYMYVPMYTLHSRTAWLARGGKGEGVWGGGQVADWNIVDVEYFPSIR